MRFISMINVVHGHGVTTCIQNWKQSASTKYGLMLPKYYCVSKATRPALNGEYILDDVQQFGFDANENDKYHRKLIYKKDNCVQDQEPGKSTCYLKHLDGATDATIAMVITGATGIHYYKTEVTHGLNMEKFDFGDDGVEFINNNVDAAKENALMGNGKQITQK